jgi:hypothetical protein
LSRFAPRRTLFVILAVALAAGTFIAGCGGDDSNGEDPQTVLDETFTNEASTTSGNLNLSASVSATGDQGGSFEASLSGPFQGDPDNQNTLPQLDWNGSVSGEGGGQSIDYEAGLVVTDDNAYIEYGGDTYEVGSDTFTKFKDLSESQAASNQAGAEASFQAGCEQALKQAGVTDTSGCDIDLSSWLTNTTNEGTEDVGGADSIHIHGDADVNQILDDVGNLVSAIPNSSAAGFDASQLSQFSDAVTDASVDIYSTEDDHLLSKFELSLTIDPSVIAAGAIPVDSVDVDFSLEIDDINQEQTIEAPSGETKPLSDLVGGSLGALGALGGAGGGNFEAYQKCLQQAGSDPDAINACASKL